MRGVLAEFNHHAIYQNLVPSPHVPAAWPPCPKGKPGFNRETKMLSPKQGHYKEGGEGVA